MSGRRNVTKDIFRAVVLGGAMLSMSACSGGAKKAEKPTTMEKKNPCEGAPKTNPCDGTKANPCDGTKADDKKANPCEGDKKANPCEGKKNPCESRNPCSGGPRGRGFILA